MGGWSGEQCGKEEECFYVSGLYLKAEYAGPDMQEGVDLKKKKRSVVGQSIISQERIAGLKK